MENESIASLLDVPSVIRDENFLYLNFKPSEYDKVDPAIFTVKFLEVQHDPLMPDIVDKMIPVEMGFEFDLQMYSPKPMTSTYWNTYGATLLHEEMRNRGFEGSLISNIIDEVVNFYISKSLGKGMDEGVIRAGELTIPYGSHKGKTGRLILVNENLVEDESNIVKRNFVE